MFDFRVLFFVRNIFPKIMLVRYRGKKNKGVLERPGTKWKVLRAISSTLKCQFTRKCWKVDFSMPCKTKSAENLHVWPYARCGHPGNPQTSPILNWIVKKTVFMKKHIFPIRFLPEMDQYSPDLRVPPPPKKKIEKTGTGLECGRSDVFKTLCYFVYFLRLVLDFCDPACILGALASSSW